MTRRTLSLALTFVAAIVAGAYAFGGWAVITLDDLPDQFMVGKPTTLSFVVRQHGIEPMHNVTPTVEARRGSFIPGETIRANALPGRKAGQYVASLVIPKAGDWRVTINSGWGSSNVTLLPMPATDGAATVAEITDAERGKRLFLAKGCATCHVNKNVEGGMQMQVGPELTGKEYDPAFLALWLANPKIKPPTKPGNEMPNLGLSQREIASLTAFIAGGKSVAARQH